MSGYHLAQLNLAAMKFAFDDPAMAGFVERLEDINALADTAPGFVWRLQLEEDDATVTDHFGTDTLVNMSVWQDIESLHAYVYRSAHNEVMALRRQWFDRSVDACAVLWWTRPGHNPSLQEARERLELLRRVGPSPQAFTFKHSYPPA